jgi:hypothetical protein
LNVFASDASMHDSTSAERPLVMFFAGFIH